MAAGSRRRILRPGVVLVVVIIIAALGATAAVALNSSAGHAYRTASVTHGAVAQQLNGTGTIQPVAQAEVAFPIAGTVASVAVAVGAHVSIGQELATLNASSLQQQLIDKEATLAAAKLTLYKALNGESVSDTGGSGSNAGGAVATTAAVTDASSGAGSGGVASGSTSSTATAQQQLLKAQQAVDAALATMDTELQASANACATGAAAEPGSPAPPARSASPGSPLTTTSTSIPATTSTSVPARTKPATTGLGTAACVAAQRALAGDEQRLANAQQSLARAEQTLERLLSTTSASAPTNSSTARSNSASTASAPSAAQLVADQAAVDAAATDVLAAQESVDQATIASPIAGTVVANSLQVGAQVGATSTTATVVVDGAGGFEISTTVGVNDIGQVKVGDAATVLPDATSRTVTGRVVWIGAASGSASATTYPVVIGLSGSSTDLRQGALATTSIELARSQSSALTVPTSAVHTTNGRHFVTVLANGKSSTVTVQIGVVGAVLTQITSGLQAGQVVVLADLHAAVPSSNANSRVATAVGSGLTGGTGLGGASLTGGGTGR